MNQRPKRVRPDSMLIEPVETKENPLRVIESCFDNALETAEHNEMDFGFMLSNFMSEFNRRNPEITKYLRDIYKVWEVNLVSTLQKGKTDGYVARHVDSESVANYLISSYIGIRTLMVEGNCRVLRYQFMQQLRNYLKSLEEKALVTQRTTH